MQIRIQNDYNPLFSGGTTKKRDLLKFASSMKPLGDAFQEAAVDTHKW